MIRYLSMKKTAAFLAGFVILTWGVYADIADQVVLVRTEYPDSVVENYERIAGWLENSGNERLSEIFRGIASGAFGSGSVIRTPGGRFLVLTNYHVTAQSDTVTLEYAGRSGSGAKFENCRVIASDIERDLALVEIPDQARELSEPLAFDTDLKRDGTEVWSAGYPGLVSSPSWQLATGTVTNQEAVVPELRVPELEYVIQHSAIIGPGSSGGPLLVRLSDNDYRIVGVNTWRYGGRDNTYFAIPAAEAAAYIAEYGDIEALPEDAELEAKLKESADRFVSEFTRPGTPNTRRMKNLVSDELVSRIGWRSYLDYRKDLEDEERDKLDSDFIGRDAYDAMKEAVAYRIGGLAGEEGGEILLIRTPIDPELTQVDYRLGENEEVIGWKWEMNRWVISRVSFIGGDKSSYDAASGKSSWLIDRDILPYSATLRGGGVLPIIAEPLPGSETKMGFGVGLLFEALLNPFLGWGGGVEYYQNSYRASAGESSVRVKNLMFPLSLRFQVPLRVSDGAVTLIPWVSAGLSFGLDIGRLGGISADSGFPIYIQAPLSAGFEMTTEKTRDIIIWGLDVTYIPTLVDLGKNANRTKGFGQKKSNVNLYHFRFGVTIRFPF